MIEMKKSLLHRSLAGLLIVLLLLPSTALGTSLSTEAEADTPLSITLTNAPPAVTAQAAIVMDQATGDILFARNVDQMRAPASTTKIMTAYIIYEEIAAGNLTHDTMITISQAASNLSRNDTRFLAAGSQHSVETLLRLIMLPSNNGACVAMADHISGSEAAFVARMNATAQRLGMDARYENAHGQWANQKSARAIAVLVRDFIARFPDILRITNMSVFYFGGVRTQNTNWRILANPEFDGFKTGTTPAAGFCLASTGFRGDRRVVVVTMASASFYARVTDSERLLNWGLAELERREQMAVDLTVSVSANVDAVRRHSNFTVTAQLSNFGSGNFLLPGGAWTVNGQTVSTFGQFTPANQRNLTLTHWIPAYSSLNELDIGIFINLPNGTRRYGSLTLPVSGLPPAQFRDIHGHWAYRDIGRAVEQNLFSGVGDGLFAPNGNMTRAMFVTVLGRVARQLGIDASPRGQAPFQDVAAGTWYSNYVTWAWEQGIVQGVSPDLFGTNNSITRQEVATLFFRFMQHYGISRPGTASIHFPDIDEISDWAVEALMEAVRIGLITGYADGRLAPRDTATRAQVAVMFLRFLDSPDYDSFPDYNNSAENEPPAEYPPANSDVPDEEWDPGPP